MQEDVEVMEINNIEGRSRGSSFRRRALTLVGVSALTLSGVGAAVFGASQAFASAFTNIQSNPYSIGTLASGGLSFSASSTTEGAASNYTFGFTVPSGVSGSVITLDGLPSTSTTTSTTLDSAVVTVNGTSTVYSNTVSTTPVNVTSTNGSPSDATITLSSSLNSGDQVSILINGFTNTSNLYGNPYTITADVGSSSSTTQVATASFSLTAGSTTSASLSNALPNVVSNLTLSTFKLSSSASSTQYVDLALSGGATFSTSESTSNYTVTYSTSGSSVVQTATVTNVAVPSTSTASNDTSVVLTLGALLAPGDTVNVVADGLTNGGTAGSFYAATTFGQGPKSGTGGVYPTITTPTSSTGAKFYVGYSLGAVSLAVNPATAGATGATYAVTFTVPSLSSTEMGSGGTPALSSVFTDNTNSSVATSGGYAVFDSTNPAANTAGSAVPSSGVPLAGVSAGDSVTVDYYGITNSNNANVTGTETLNSVSSGTASTTYGYLIPVKTNTVAYSTGSNTSGLNVSVSNPVVGGYATYTISGLVVGGSGVYPAGSQIQLDFSTGSISNDTGQTNLGLPPSGSADYSLTDLTTSSSSGLSKAVPGNVTTTGETNVQDITFTLKNAITAGDSISISISGVLNPSAAATNEYVTADGSGSPTANSTTVGYLPLTTGTVAVSTAPNAASTMASGSLVQFGGTIYVVAGGVAYGIPTFSDYQTIANGLGDPAVVQSSTAPSTTGTLAMGTLVQVVGSPQINVVGSNNTYYGFSSVSEFESDGYNFANVIQIPSLGGLTAGSGTAPNAASTMASGSLVQFGGTIYVVAGGVAYGIPTFSDYQTISAALGNPMVVQSSTAPSTTGTPVSGTLVQTVGSAQINVYTSTGTEVGFSTASEFTGDGYSFAKVILIP